MTQASSTDSRGISFGDRLFQAVQQKDSAVVVGLDPDLTLIPPELFRGVDESSSRRMAAVVVKRFLQPIIGAVADVAVAVKPQLAYFERLGPYGMEVYEELVRYAQAHDLLVITDAKRNDVPQTAWQYSIAYLGLNAADQHVTELTTAIDREGPKTDALTVNGYLGRDGIQPFVDNLGSGQGLFVLVKTSNPSSGDLQDLQVAGELPGRTVAHHVASWIEEWNAARMGELGYGPVGAVVGATYPEELAILRSLMPKTPFLIPGFGAQGGTAADVRRGFDARGLGAVVNASRSILYAYRKSADLSFDQAARRAAITMRDALRKA